MHTAILILCSRERGEKVSIVTIVYVNSLFTCSQSNLSIVCPHYLSFIVIANMKLNVFATCLIYILHSSTAAQIGNLQYLCTLDGV